METLVLVLTDAQGSTRLWAEEPDEMDRAVRRHHEIVHGAVADHGGFRPPDQGEGDAVFAAFTSPVAAVEAVVRMQQQLHDEPWPTSRPLRVRIGVHVGEVRVRDGNLFGDPVNRCARIRGLAAGGQTLLSSAVFELVRDRLPAGVGVTDLGEHRMKDLTRPERIHQLDIGGVEGEFPPLASLNRIRHNLPVHATPFVGRERDLARVVETVHEHRLTTITGFGGMGKTRLALQAAAELAGQSARATADPEQAPVGDVWFVDLTSETDPDVVPARVAEAAGVGYDDDPTAALLTALHDTPTLLVLDNLEHLLGCAGFVADLVSRTTGVRVLTTTREALRIRAEHVLPLDTMTLPDTRDASTPSRLVSSEAVRFFLDRARSVKADFAVTPGNAAAVAAICTRLEGHPLALELAAARLRMMTAGALLTRLDTAMKILTGGHRDMPTRHQTLHATIAWSYGMLTEQEQTLLARMSALPAPADLEFLVAVCGDDLDAFTVLESLLDRSMVRNFEPDDTSDETRYGLLVAVRDHAAEQLGPADARALLDRHADHLTTVLSDCLRDDPAHHNDLVQRLLPHVRRALEHRRAEPDHRFVALAVGVETALEQIGFAVESQAASEFALTLDPTPYERASLLASLVEIGPQRQFLDRARAAHAAATACGDASLITWTASCLLFAGVIDDEFERVLTVYQQHVDHVPDLERANAANVFTSTLSVSLRYRDPDRAEQLLRDKLDRPADTDPMILIGIARILLDRGDTAGAGVLLEVDGRGLGNADNVGWALNRMFERARLAFLLGRHDQARTLARQAFDRSIEIGRAPMTPAAVLADLSRTDDDPQAVVDVVDAALAAGDELGGAVGETLRWRRGRALLELGRTEAARDDLDAARAVLAADPVGGPRELLGCLAAVALLVHHDDPDQAAALLATIAERRGRWVLPHVADRDVATVTRALHHG